MVSGSIWWPRGGGQRSPRGAHGAAQPQTPAGFCPWPCFQCLFSLPSLFSRATVAPGPPPHTVQLGHFHTYSIPPQESLLYIKQTFLLPNANRIHSGILQLVLCFCLCIWGCNYWLPLHLHAQLTVRTRRRPRLVYCTAAPVQAGVRGREINSVTEAAVHLCCWRSPRLAVFLLLTRYIIHHTIDMLTIGSAASFTAVDSTCILYSTNEMWVIRCHLSSMYPIWLLGQRRGRSCASCTESKFWPKWSDWELMDTSASPVCSTKVHSQIRIWEYLESARSYVKKIDFEQFQSLAYLNCLV